MKQVSSAKNLTPKTFLLGINSVSTGIKNTEIGNSFNLNPLKIPPRPADSLLIP
jgi:hypothetical protein